MRAPQPEHGRQPGAEPYPASLLAEYLAQARRRGGDALPATALRTRSLATRELLAYAAAGQPRSLDWLLRAAREGNRAGHPPTGLDPRGLANLARVIAFQQLLPQDLADGLALYDLGLEMFGPQPIPPRDQAVHAQLAYHLGDRARARALLATYPAIPQEPARALRVDLANPFPGRRGGQAEAWFAAFRELLPEPRPMLASPDGLAPFDRLATPGVRRVDSPHRISVVLTAYRPGAELLTAVRSLLQQSWANVEIVLVDDGSPPEHELVLSRCRAMDPRVTLVELDANRGTYEARNAGLDAATGEFVTFQDSDDWSHPVRLEHQVRPLLREPALVATLTDALRVTNDLVITRPGRLHRSVNESSLMVRREPVLRRVGYFDQVRKAADSEYRHRVEAAFGLEAVRQDHSGVYALVRLSNGSLSRTEIGPGWMHPARVAYRSAYDLWHARIRAGAASPYLPKRAGTRPIPAPAQVRGARVPARPTRYDVVFLGDWRTYGGSQRATLEEIGVLTRAGLRVGMAQQDGLGFLTTWATRMCAPIQGLINDGTVDQVLLGDEAEASLLVIRHPEVLQFAAAEPSRITARQVMILASRSPLKRDGSYFRYVPRTCAEVALAWFGVEPQWCPRGPVVRGVLEQLLSPAAMAPYDLPGVIEVDQWSVDRSRPRLDRPVIGRHTRDEPATWPGDRDTMLAAYPGSDDVDVRVLGGATTPLSVLGGRALPPNWVAYEAGDVGIRDFLNQLDYYVYFPHADVLDAVGRGALEALATGCVTILPHHFSATFGDAAVYCDPPEVRDVIASFHASRASYLDQSRLAQQRVRERHGPHSYAELVSRIITSP